MQERGNRGNAVQNLPQNSEAHKSTNSPPSPQTKAREGKENDLVRVGKRGKS